MKYTVRPTTKFQKDLKRIQKRGYNIDLLTEIIKKLANGEGFHQRTETMRLPVTMRHVGNVILHPTGF